MKSVDGPFLFTFIFTLFNVLWAQTHQVVTVGDSGSFYVPAAIEANVGDIVTFQWTGKFHSVTQSSFDNPCFPLPGGFDSGITGNSNGILTVPAWSLTITDTNPIYYFCKATSPMLHCTFGMVGTINVLESGSNTSYTNFSLKAKAIVSPSPIPTGVPPALTGIGALATSVPLPTMNQTNVTTTALSSTSTSSSTSSTASQTSTPINAATHVGLSGGAIGGIVGGILGAVIFLVLIFLALLSYRRARKYKKEAQVSQILNRPDPMAYVASSRTLPSDRLVDIHRSQRSGSVNDSLERESTAGPSINVKELAAEIAKNMRQETRGGGTHEMPQSLDTVLEQPYAGNAGNTQWVNPGHAPPTATSDTTSPNPSVNTSIDPPRTHGSRPLPTPQARPPPTSMNHRRAADTQSVDTLPAYRYPQ